LFDRGGREALIGKLLDTRQVSVVRGRHELALIDMPLED